MLNIDIRIQDQITECVAVGLLGMLNIDIRIHGPSTKLTLSSLLGMLNIDIRILVYVSGCK